MPAGGVAARAATGIAFVHLCSRRSIRPTANPLTPLLRLHPVRSGRAAFIHANSPIWATARYACLRRPIMTQFAECDGEALETILPEGGGCGAHARTHHQRERHRQAGVPSGRDDRAAMHEIDTPIGPAGSLAPIVRVCWYCSGITRRPGPLERATPIRIRGILRSVRRGRR